MIFVCYLKHSLLLLAASVFILQLNAQNSQLPSALYQQKMQSAALLFMENKGQVADDKGHLQPDIIFSANSGGAKIYLTATGIHYQFSKTEFRTGTIRFQKIH